ncbi:simple sugar transport system substrate-binding protein [Pseudochelatococcus lubricantis]|uniref:Simple sugar transport system substrate-binding protein n=1 Tax=Pseudochelatococcus lubricantis TaxID=1538102 RepID=A0ABX0V0Z2_9HYPH|nr:BMP family ABC transporter substrate-binding protein [Pseudochelatococcus lubricantis]NIJ57855.1 simple sugar transport system substrate-binding protein [Pseudochelatococcus lubricantis]
MSEITSLPLSRRSLIVGAGATAAMLAGTRTGLAADPLKVGFVYVGPIGDHGYSYSHDLGRKAVEAEFGDRVKVTFVENVNEGPDSERVIRQLATAGNGLIFSTSFGFMQPTIRVARQFPKVVFEHATGYMRADNVGIYNGRFYEGRAVLGTIAGLVSKTGSVGYVASFPIPEVIMGINAFLLAARKVRPDLTVKVIWLNSWYDPGKEADAAKALIDGGADVIAQHVDSPAAMQVAEARGAYAFGQASDMSRFAPRAHLTAIVYDWAPYYKERVKLVLDGAWKSDDTWWGLKEGLIRMAPYNPSLPEEIRKQADAVRDAIAAGTLQPFAGPVKDQKGAVRIAAGETISDADLLKMDWLVEGVQS